MATQGFRILFKHVTAVLVWISLLALCEACVSPPSCQCDMIGPAKRPRGRKVNCSKQPNPFKTLTGITFPPDSVTLDLSFNKLVQLKQRSFIQLSKLKKL
ncbi:hypothetical protein PoB_006303500 [Plakobranchus ocellatus]|uniref:LRRNT domain-containing protein n=1 Tax=Plakobranchus ocellatus TaxID=259542 RepID=A0AAV4CXM0_9GAST|nr:hypothetical protein PoB_006303500 [Plakobranchus ocellatus]